MLSLLRAEGSGEHLSPVQARTFVSLWPYSNSTTMLRLLKAIPEGDDRSGLTPPREGTRSRLSDGESPGTPLHPLPEQCALPGAHPSAKQPCQAVP
jgi:hypothetical protein